MFFDPVTGNSGKAKVRNNNGGTEVYMQLLPGESIILKTFTDKDVKFANWNYYKPSGNEQELTNNWELSFVESQPEVSDSFQIDTLCSWTDIDNNNLKINMGTARYSTTFTVENPDAEDYLLKLGDVRESARIFVNDKEVITLFAVPFQTYIGEYLRSGVNKLDVEVTNLPANRIAEYDRQGVEWRKFNEINFVDVNYKKTKYDGWEVMPSGLLGPVVLQPVVSKE